MKLTRRTVLAGATGVLASCGRRYDLTGAFPLSVASGDVTASTAVLWTMYGGSSAPTVRVWADESNVFEAAVAVDDSGFVHVDATGLQSFTWYSFEFADSLERSAKGRFRTALADGQMLPLTFGAVSCLKQGYPLQTLAQAAARSDLDAFLFLGDTVYADGAKDLPGFRDKWSQAIAHPAHRALRASTSAIDTWDDHELYDNWNADEIPREELAAGLQAFYDFQPLHPGPNRRIWRSLKWGATAEVFVLDCRGERRPSTDHYLSPEQLDWLKDGLKKSTAAFKVILNSVPISNFPGAFFEATAGDRWQGYPKQREEILSAIEDAHLRGVLWVSGDFHLASMGRVSQNGPGSKAIEVLVGPGGQMPNASPSYPDQPQFDWASGINNYTTFSLDPAALSVEVKFFDGNGRLLTRKTYSL